MAETTEKQYLDYAGLGRVVANMTQTFSKVGHNHDDVYYTESEIDGKVATLNSAISGKVPTSRTVNGKALSADITLSASDVGAAAASHGNHVPATQTASNKVFLRNDNTWATVTPGNIGAYTKAEVDSKVSAINTSIGEIKDGDVVVAEAEHAETADTATNAGHATTADTAASCTGNAATATSATKATQDGNGKNIASTYETKTDATAKLTAAKSYTDTEIAKLINASDDGVLNSITELADAIETNQGAIEALNSIADGKAAKDHTHTITASASDDDVVILTGTNGTNKVTYSASHANSGVTAGTYRSVTVDAKGHVTDGTNPTTLAGYGITDAAAKSHKHTVSQISDLTATAAELNIMDGVTATTAEINYLDGVTSGIQAQLDAKAASSSLTSHTGNGDIHVTAAQKTNWNTAYTHSQAAHAPSGAEVNQNAFSNVKVGTTTVAAKAKTDTITFVAGSNVTITPDATNKQVTIAATDTKYTHPTSGVTAASYGDSTNQTPDHGGTFKVPYFTVNAAGHVTAASAHTVTLPTIESISDDAIDTIFANLNA